MKIFHNTDLTKDLEKILDYDTVNLAVDTCQNDDEVIHTLEVNDNTYMYHLKSDREADYEILFSLIQNHKP